VRKGRLTDWWVGDLTNVCEACFTDYILVLNVELTSYSILFESRAGLPECGLSRGFDEMNPNIRHLPWSSFILSLASV
jgi:hypothetical protein